MAGSPWKYTFCLPTRGWRQLAATQLLDEVLAVERRQASLTQKERHASVPNPASAVVGAELGARSVACVATDQNNILDRTDGVVDDVQESRVPG